jgi:hypothetical protein
MLYPFQQGAVDSSEYEQWMRSTFSEFGERAASLLRERAVRLRGEIRAKIPDCGFAISQPRVG